MILVKKHDAGDGRSVLALCDSDLKGKVLKEKGIILDLSADFYNGEETNEEQIRQLLKTSYIVNFVGEKSVKLGREAGLIEETIKVCGVPHAQSFSG